MNVERLHSLLLDAIQDIENSDIPHLCEVLREYTQHLAQNPQHEPYQREFAARRSELLTALEAMAYNSFSPGVIEDLNQLGIAQYMGNDLTKRINDIFDENTLTLAVAASEIAQVQSDFKQLFKSLQSTVETFKQLNIPTEEPDPGEVEVSVILPRHLFEEDLKSLGNEFRELERIFADITELSTGKRLPTKVRSIAASDFSLYLEYAPQAAALFAVTVERVIALYKKLLEIRILRSKLAAEGVENERLEGVDNYIKEHMKKGIKGILDDIFNPKEVQNSENIKIAIEDEGRKNELRASFKMTLTGIAARVDRGYRFDVRIGQSTQDDKEKDDGSDARLKNSKAKRIIEEHREGLQYLKLTGHPILELPSTQAEDKDALGNKSEANTDESEDI